VVWSADDGVIVAPGGNLRGGGASFSLTPNSKFPPRLAPSASGGGLALRSNGDELDQMG
jgi:hypothetical protein